MRQKIAMKWIALRTSFLDPIKPFISICKHD
jgi:hypothetical protein